MKIFDCFQFFDEEMMLSLRLNVLDQFVDKFIIVENLFMHSGRKKKQNFDIKKFEKFKNKIRYILVDRLPENLFDIENFSGSEKTNRIIDNTLKIEHNQRNKILDGLYDAERNDLILISDVDEIPKLENIKNKIKNKIICFNQKMFCYKFNLSYPNTLWTGTKGVLKKNMKNPQWLRDVKDRKYSFWRFDIIFNKMKYNNIQFIQDGGWHFTNLRTPKELELKLNNFGHHAEFKESGKDIYDLEKMIKENKAIYDYTADMKKDKWSGEKKLKKVDIIELPQFIKSNNKLFKDWLC
jgi:beta-1,4-mannosyl-glycoprotein beta-1,4-N-acetylglucosaminyltransferase